VILVIAADEAEARELRAIVGEAVVFGRRPQRPTVVIHTPGQIFGTRIDRIWVRTKTMQDITADPDKWNWWETVVRTRMRPGPPVRPEYI
jgi:hypothetical protein